jgi:hypothetical protein
VDTRDDKVFSFIQKCEQLFPRYRWKIFQKSLDRFTRLNIFDEGLHRDTRTCKYWVPPSISGETVTIRVAMPLSYAKNNPVTTIGAVTGFAFVLALYYCFAPAFLM